MLLDHIHVSTNHACIYQALTIHLPKTQSLVVATVLSLLTKSNMASFQNHSVATALLAFLSLLYYHCPSVATVLPQHCCHWVVTVDFCRHCVVTVDFCCHCCCHCLLNLIWSRSNTTVLSQDLPLCCHCISYSGTTVTPQ